MTMLKSLRLNRMSLWRLFLLYLLSLLVPPIVVSIVLMIVDSRRKHVRSQGYFVSLREVPAIEIGDHNESSVQLYTYGEDLYAALLEAIEQARQRIFLETYICDIHL